MNREKQKKLRQINDCSVKLELKRPCPAILASRRETHQLMLCILPIFRILFVDTNPKKQLVNIGRLYLEETPSCGTVGICTVIVRQAVTRL